jgi:hypothetical protein
MKSASPDKTRTTPPCEAAADQVATDASAAWRTWLTALTAKLADLAPFTAEIVTMILGFLAADHARGHRADPAPRRPAQGRQHRLALREVLLRGTAPASGAGRPRPICGSWAGC